QSRHFDAFLGAFRDGARAIRIGSGFDEATQMGPLVSRRRLDAIEGLVADAVANGAQVATGGARVGARGYFFAPTILTGVGAGARFMTEEPFGPVASVAPFDTMHEAIALANHGSLGLASYVHSSSQDVVAQAIDGLEAGVVGVNNFAISRPQLPFG